MVSSVRHLNRAADIAGLPADLAHGQRPQAGQNDARGNDGDDGNFRRQDKANRYGSANAARKKREQRAAFSGSSREYRKAITARRPRGPQEINNEGAGKRRRTRQKRQDCKRFRARESFIDGGPGR